MLERVGTAAIAFLASVGEAALFGVKAAREIFVPPFEFRETIRQIY
jgi:ABC-type transporter Mla maintaining outer membrane lipid asymmetry permease subunit MlaE